MLRIEPKFSGTVRVQYTERDEFVDEESIGLIENSESSSWDVNETDTEYIIKNRCA